MTRILAFPRSAITQFLNEEIVPWHPDNPPERSVWHERAALEQDESHLQLIAYAILHRAESVWCYRRTGGDARLDGRRSIGVGGHVDETDDRGSLLATARAALARELSEELLPPHPAIPPHPIAWINEQHSAIGRVHLGLVWAISWPHEHEPAVAHGEKLIAEGFHPLSAISPDSGYEYWSVLAARCARHHLS